VLIELNTVGSIEIYSCEDYTLSYNLTYDRPYDFKKEEIILKQLPYLFIESKSPKSLEWFIDILELKE
jgi:hypothetical protein